MDPQVSQMRSIKFKNAALSETLAQRELTGRVLRLELEAKKRTAGSTKTDAERDAKVDALYLDHEKKSIALSYDRAVAEAEAEALLLGIRLRVADLALGVE